MSNSKFVLTFAGLLIFFVALTFGIYFLAGLMSSDVNSKLSNAAQEIMKEHTNEVTRPVASFAVGDPSEMQAAVTSSSDAGSVDVGEQIYKTYCTSCHAAGLADAPITGDKESWANRIEKGLDALYTSAIGGIGSMPAKGGSKESDEDIKLAVNYLVRQADPSAAPAPEVAAPATENAGEVEAAIEETTEVVMDAGEITESSVVDAVEETAEAAAPVAAVVDTAAGETLYNKACVACHAAGILEAPITGDKDAWSTRISKGLDALYASAINGIGKMPPKGGSNADDATVKSAVDYMVSQSQ